MGQKKDALTVRPRVGHGSYGKTPTRGLGLLLAMMTLAYYDILHGTIVEQKLIRLPRNALW
jgi:hypothetical protein